MCRSLVQDMHILLDTAIPAMDQRQALKMRYGLATGEPASYVKIARTLGISNQAAVTVVQRAFDTLRQQRGLWERILQPYIQVCMLILSSLGDPMPRLACASCFSQGVLPVQTRTQQSVNR